jgi:hypothetical protein
VFGRPLIPAPPGAVPLPSLESSVA